MMLCFFNPDSDISFSTDTTCSWALSPRPVQILDCLKVPKSILLLCPPFYQQRATPTPWCGMGRWRTVLWNCRDRGSYSSREEWATYSLEEELGWKENGVPKDLLPFNFFCLKKLSCCVKLMKISQNQTIHICCMKTISGKGNISGFFLELKGTRVLKQNMRDLLIPLFLETPCRYNSLASKLHWHFNHIQE